MMRELISIKAWKELLDLNTQSYLFTILFYLVITESYDYASVLNILVLISLLSLYLLYTFLLNDYCDMPFDIKAGKKRAIHKIPEFVTVSIIISFVLMSILLIVFLLLRGSFPGYTYTFFIPVYAAAYVLSTSYSAFPMRLKERGVWGIIDDVLIEKTLPVFLIFAFFNYYSLEALIVVSCFSSLQLKIILDHQCWDYDSDVKSGVRTFAVARGIEKATAILAITRKLFLAFFLLLIAILGMKCAYSLIVIIPLFFGYFIIKNLVDKGKLDRGNIRGDLNIPVEWVSKTPLYDGYIVTSINVIALFMAILLAVRNYHYSFLLPLVLMSQYYLIKGHYIRILKNIFFMK